MDRYDGGSMLQPDDLGFNGRRAKMGEKFENFDEIFGLE